MFVAAPALAAPAAPHEYTLAQPDGTEFVATVWGDERAAGVETADGYTIVLDTATGFWKYAERGAAGALVPSARVVGWDAPVAIDRHMRPAPTGPDEAGAPQAPGPAPGGQGAPATLGPHRLLVLLVEFTPAQSRGTTEADWEALAFSGGIATAPDSLADYWSEVSYGQVTLVPASETAGAVDNGIVEVTLGTAHPNTAGDDANRQLTSDALVAADPFVNYAAFDDNGNGFLDSNELHVLVVARGYERAYGGADVCAGAGSVWGHHWSLYGSVPAPTIDGVIVGDPFGGPAPGPRQGGYNQIGEWHCRSTDNPGHMATIGVAAHELGHDMGTGVPDLYDTDGSSQGIGRWSLQAGGAWNTTGGYVGKTPAWPDAWSRAFLGFITPAQPPTCANDWAFPQIETAASAPAHGVVRLRDNPGGVDWEWGASGSGEYFLIENRQLVGFDAGLPGAGLLIWHVYEAAPGDNSTNANEGTCPPGNPRLVALEQADGDFDIECFDACGGACNSGDGGDAWAAGAAFHGSSTPSSDLYSGADTGVRVDDISASGANMTADLGYVPCSDGAACTSADTCVQGVCVGTPYSCADGNVCTDDVCQGDGTCAFPNNAAACNDGDACTSGDTCAAGACGGAPYSCADGNPCTDDVCQGDGTCVFPSNTSACDDGLSCTSGDVCAAGACGGAPYSCDDGNVCTDDVCQGDGTCVFQNNSAACDDGLSCTSGDVCAAGACGGAPYSCDDGNLCTDDVCQGDGTCARSDNTAPCDDGNACTWADACVAGGCGGTPYACDDGDTCTDDFCAGDGSCVFFDNAATCDDGDPCTSDDTCAAGACDGTPFACNDRNPCTADSCDGATCTHVAADGVACTSSDPCAVTAECSRGVCFPTSFVLCDPLGPCVATYCVDGQCENDPLHGVACDDGNPCTTGDQCDVGRCDGELVECDDRNACTDDACADGECAFLANTEPCDDGNACTSEDTCAAGACMGSTYSCDDGDTCTADLCEGDGTCSHIPQMVDCDDHNACTADSCDGKGACVHVEVCSSDAGADMGSATSTGDGCACRAGSRSRGATPWGLALVVLLAVRRRSTLR